MTIDQANAIMPETEPSTLLGEAQGSADWEYICVSVVRSESTDVYLKVPKGWRPSGEDYKMMARAAKETTSDSDWDRYGWENDVEVQGHKPVDAKEAEQYLVFDALPFLLSQNSSTRSTQRRKVQTKMDTKFVPIIKIKAKTKLTKKQSETGFYNTRGKWVTIAEATREELEVEYFEVCRTQDQIDKLLRKAYRLLGDCLS